MLGQTKIKKKKASAEINKIAKGLTDIGSLRKEYSVVAMCADTLEKVVEAAPYDDALVKQLGGQEQVYRLSRQASLANEYRDILAARICLLMHNHKEK